MHVTHVVPTLFRANGGIIGGAERYALELARHMAERAPTTLVSFGEKRMEERMGSLRIRVLGPAHFVRNQRSNPIAFGLLQEIRRSTVVHCHQQHVVASSVSALMSRVAGRRCFVSDLGGGGWDVSGYISTDSWYHGHLHISEYSRTLSGTQKGSHVIYGGVDVNKFSPPSSNDSRSTVLFVGRLLPHKGVNYLIEGLPEDARLEIIGQPYHEGYFEHLQKLARGKQVSFLTGCDDEAIVQAYRRATCIVLPSVYRTLYGDETKVPELLGQTLLEGMACGAAAICTDVASMPEIVQDGVNGFIVPPNNPQAIREKLSWLLNQPEEAAKMGRAARQRVLERFNWTSVVDQCLSIYGTALDPQ